MKFAPESTLPPRIGIAGASGRMGQMLIGELTREMTAGEAASCTLRAAFVRTESSCLGRDAGSGVPFSTLTSPRELADIDVLIDFSRADVLSTHLAHCRAAGVRMVIGVTGLDAPAQQAMHVAAQDIGVLFAPNMSIGINLAYRLIALAAQALDAHYDIEIVETHHRHKVDAPSGTALRMGEVAATARGGLLSELAILTREGQTGPRRPGSIGFATVRGGDVVGEHSVHFLGPHEAIEIRHRASSRCVFAQGALRAARWMHGRPAGFYEMQDVLGLASVCASSPR